MKTINEKHLKIFIGTNQSHFSYAKSVNRNKQATKICFSKPLKLYSGEEVSSSPDKTENTVSIFLLRLN